MFLPECGQILNCNRILHRKLNVFFGEEKCLTTKYVSFLFIFQQIYMGIYVAFIKHWASVYGLENMLVLKMEDRLKDPVKEFKKVLQYLELGKFLSTINFIFSNT